MICADKDSCPLDTENDADSDAICGDVDTCPYDAANDADSDGVCATITCVCASPDVKVPYFMITRLKVRPGGPKKWKSKANSNSKGTPKATTTPKPMTNTTITTAKPKGS